MDGTVRYDRDGAVATLTLDRPERLDAIVPGLIAVRRLRPGAAVTRAALAVLLAAALMAGCGDSGPTDEEQVRTVVAELGRATAAKDYQALCDRILAPSLIEDVKQIGLPCEVALQRGLGDVKDPKITIGKVTVTDDKATAEVRTVATGQAPSRDTLALVRVQEAWRVSSLGG